MILTQGFIDNVCLRVVAIHISRSYTKYQDTKCIWMLCHVRKSNNNATVAPKHSSTHGVSETLQKCLSKFKSHHTVLIVSGHQTRSGVPYCSL